MCSHRPACCLNELRGSGDGGDDDLCPQCRSPSSCDEFKDHRRLVHIISICRECGQTAEGEFFSHVSQAEPQRRNRSRENCLLMICVLFSLLAFAFLRSVGKEHNDVQHYDADVVLPSKVLWLLGSLLLWTVWLLLHLLQMSFWLINGLLWLISISAAPLCHCLSFLLSCVLLLLHYMCDTVFFATTSVSVYAYGMLLSVGILVLVFPCKDVK